MMNLYSPKEIKNILNKYGVRPKKSLGQHFVINKGVIDKIIQAADLKRGDTALEIGPGIGTLTRELAKRVKNVVAVEKDAAMCEILKNILNAKNVKNVKIIHDDILKIFQRNREPRQWERSETNRAYKLVANIPYYITQPIIRLFLETGSPPNEIILLIQKEVAQRICAKPPRMNLLAISVQFYAKPEIIDYVSKNNFWPMPKVDSAIIRITCAGVSPAHREGFFRMVRAGFSSPRKMLINNLVRKLEIPREKLMLVFDKFRLDYRVRAENLNVEEWKNLSTTLFGLDG